MHDKVKNMFPSVKISDRREIDKLVGELDSVRSSITWFEVYV
jgi:hypothetical protein